MWLVKEDKGHSQLSSMAGLSIGHQPVRHPPHHTNNIVLDDDHDEDDGESWLETGGAPFFMTGCLIKTNGSLGSAFSLPSF